MAKFPGGLGDKLDRYVRNMNALSSLEISDLLGTHDAHGDFQELAKAYIKDQNGSGTKQLADALAAKLAGFEPGTEPDFSSLNSPDHDKDDQKGLISGKIKRSLEAIYKDYQKSLGR